MSDRIPHKIHYSATGGPTLCGGLCSAQRFKTTFPAKVTCGPCRDILIGARKHTKITLHMREGDGALCRHRHANPKRLVTDENRVNCHTCLSMIERDGLQ